MKKWAERLLTYIGNPLPTFFDLCVVVGIVPISYISSPFRGIYFVFFSIFLMCLSTCYPEKRVLKSIWMALILIWSFISVFIHSFILTGGGAYNWINYCLMSEGFIYMFFGVFLLKTIASYSRNIRLLWISVPIASYPTIEFMISHGQVSLILAFAMAFFIYFIMTKRWKISAGLVVLCVLLIIFKHTAKGSLFDWIMFKWAARPYVWIELSRQICEHPFVGTGYNKLLTPDNMTWVRQIGQIVVGWLWRHNDYLSITAFLGLPILIPILMLLKDLFIRFKRFAYVVPFMAFCFLSFTQMTMFIPEKALIIIVLIAAFYVET